MAFADDTSKRLICERRHSYDAGRWINFLTRPVSTYYGKALFEARRRVWAAGFFDPLAVYLADILSNSTIILDAGCGEGTPLIRTLENVTDRSEQFRAVGVDLSRDAVRMASGLNKSVRWLVADLTHLPLRDGAFDTVLNLLSPACYEEFARVLMPGGRLVKVLPESEHLCEIRELLPKERISTLAPRESVTDRLESRFDIISAERLTMRRRAPVGLKEPLVRMAPFYAHLRDTECAELALSLGDEIRLDLSILTAVLRKAN
jgi:23S rRNA (guanine745-N1)-methyltransferase